MPLIKLGQQTYALVNRNQKTKQKQRGLRNWKEITSRTVHARKIMQKEKTKIFMLKGVTFAAKIEKNRKKRSTSQTYQLTDIFCQVVINATAIRGKSVKKNGWISPHKS